MAKWIVAETEHEPLKGPEGVPVAIISMLRRRGVPDAEMEDFFSDHPKNTFDPFLLNGVRAAAERILAVLDGGGCVCVYGDYDADGVTATALLYSVFRRFSGNVRYYIPSRFSDGYGLNVTAINDINERMRPQLIVTVDCGITSKAEVAHAKALGIDVIVTDHHNIKEGELPDCLRINPHGADSDYPFRNLSGCGVAFKVAQAIQRICAERGDGRFDKAKLGSLLDLVAISTVADVVPLLGENRTLVKYGLAKLNSMERPGIAILAEMLGLSGKTVSSENVAYIIAPHINAMGRMSSADQVVELLSGVNTDEAELRRLASAMIESNRDRRAEQEKAGEICREALAGGECGELFPVILAPGAHEGVTGIVAGNLKEMLYRPVFVLTPCGDGTLKGTGRCIPGINLHTIMKNNSELFLRFGGHAGACGFSMEEKNLPALRERMQEAVSSELASDPDLLTEKLYLEKILEPQERTIEFARQLERLEPFGEGNPRPLFCIPGVRIRSAVYMGADSQHVRFTAVCGDGAQLSCILFSRAAEYAALLGEGTCADLAAELSVNEFGGRRRLQLIIRDMRPAQDIKER